MQVVRPDTEYRIEQFAVFNDRQTDFYLHRTEQAMLEAVQRLRGPGRQLLLDVGCGLGMQAGRLALRGWEAYGIDASDQMLMLGQFRFPVVHRKVCLARGIAESLPFQDNSFDAVMCQGAMDHFADHRRFLAEVERVLKPGGHFVVALANYESLACRIGKALFHDVARVLGIETPSRYQFWKIPVDHTFVGSYRLVKGMATARFRLAAIHGASMFLFLPPWRELLEALPQRMARAVFKVVDRLAYHSPSAADVVIATLRKEDAPSSSALPPAARGNGRKRSSDVPSYPLPR